MMELLEPGAILHPARNVLRIRSLLALGLFLLPVVAASGESTIPGYRERQGVWVFDDPFPENQPRATGLQHRFPPMPGTDENPVTPEKVELGRLLFFDSILSGDNSMSCATCHHPDLGMADGRRLGMGLGGTAFGTDRTGGRELARNTPSLWNAGFNDWQFWDGRVRRLEEQASIPLTNPDEMAEEPERLVAELKGIPEYVGLFANAFGVAGAEAVTFENVIRALTSFERTLVSFESKFDRYAAGDFSALDASEKNGLKLFRSLETRCFECHSFPTFSDGSFRVIGVPDEGEPDLGRGATAERAADHSFRVPSLRNVELTAPYMHNGSLPTLEEVVKFYSEGGGRREASPVPMIDDKIQKFDITPEESADLVAFLKALTDTSHQPPAPDRVPSGLPVLPVQFSPPPVVTSEQVARTPAVAPDRTNVSPRVIPIIRLPPGADHPLEIIPTEHTREARADSGQEATMTGRLPLATFHVMPGQSIQAALDRAQSGDFVELAPGVFTESVEVKVKGVTIMGSDNHDSRAIMDGGGTMAVGITAFADNLTVRHLTLRNYRFGAISAELADLPNIEDLLIEPASLDLGEN